MSHVVIIVQEGTGTGGSAKGTIEWSPSHGITPVEEARRREKAERLLKKANHVLYGEYSDSDED